MEKTAVFDIPEEHKNSAGIYRIVFLLDILKFYIGSTYNLSQRFKGHSYCVRTKRRDCRKLHNAMIKHGIENFKFELVEIVDINGLNKKEAREKIKERENIWLKPKPYYNICEDATSTLGIKHPKNAKSRIQKKGAKSPSAKAVDMYTLKDVYIKTYNCGLEIKGISRDKITRCCKGMLFSAGGFRFAYAGKKLRYKRVINKKSRFKGIFYKKMYKKWEVNFIHNHKRIYGGIFKTPEEAAARYNELAIKYIGKSAKLNKINKKEKCIV